MTDDEREPLIVLVATATDRHVENRHLRELPAERRAIRDALEAAQNRGLCRFEPLADATLEEVFKAFERHRDRIAIFHFGGHANSGELMLHSGEGTPVAAGGKGLAEFLGEQKGLQLVFLNACSTYGHVEALHRAGVPLVVATSRGIVDSVARQFAGRFYSALGSGASIKAAFDAAAAEAKSGAQDKAKNLQRDLEPEDAGRNISREGWPWDIKTARGEDAGLEWSLTEAAGDPTFGIPPVPKDDLPDQSEGPYLGLRRFERKHAELFFGRGIDIRALYEWLTTREEPILVLHGQSGVGKSSLLQAGFLPRLENDYEVRLRRRLPQDGLLRTFVASLGAADDVDLSRVWKEAEQTLGKRLLVVLDQVEEVFTQPIPALPFELDDLIDALAGIFKHRDQRPKGKLILALRKDYHPEIEARLKRAALYRIEHYVQPLSRAGIVEAITGPVRDARLRKHFRFEIARPAEGDEPLPEAIADVLRVDPDSPIAPTLQVLLAKMWDAVKDEENPRFDRGLFGELAKPGEGGFLDTFLGEQLEVLAIWQPVLAKAGLFIDFMAFHTTPVGTAKSRTWNDLSTNYAHHEALLPELIERCKKLRLLAEQAGASPLDGDRRATRLAHDTIAPLIRARFDRSELPGQRARRILESRCGIPVGRAAIGAPPAFGQQREFGGPLGGFDVVLVQAGEAGMRVRTPLEEELIEVSQMGTPSRHVICLDGERQSPYISRQRDDGSQVPSASNVRKFSRAVLPTDLSNNRLQITYYESGAGSFKETLEDKFLDLANNYHPGDEVFVFGFGRGAALARALTHFLDWLGGIPAKSDAHLGALYFHRYVMTRGTGRPENVTTADGRRPEKPIVPVTVKFLGVWDTVMPLGSRFQFTMRTSSTGQPFYIADTPAECVKNVRQALAIDETRYDLRPEVWSRTARDQGLEQRWFAGSHSNVGGGYVNDGLANIPFRWLINEAQASGLAINRDFVKHFKPYPQARLYRSTGLVYQALEFVRLRSGRGMRRITGYPESANTTLDRSVIHRIRSAPDEHPQLDQYRPENVIELLAAQDDLEGYLAGLGLNPKDCELPEDVVTTIHAIRHERGSSP